MSVLRKHQRWTSFLVVKYTVDHVTVCKRTGPWCSGQRLGRTAVPTSRLQNFIISRNCSSVPGKQ